MSSDKENPIIRLRGTPELMRRVDRVAKKKSLKREDIVRIAVAEYVAREEAA